MEIIIVLAIVAVVGICANKYMNKRSETEVKNKESEQVLDDNIAVVNSVTSDQTKVELKSESNNKEDNVMEETKGTRDLFLETLTKIGCQYETGDGEDDDINFGYQGEYFVVRASNNNRFIHIYDTHWGHVELYNIDEFSRLKKAINESNIKNSVTAVYTIDEAGSNVHVHCKSVILFTPEIPDIADYLRLELSEYFRVHETVNMEMAKQRDAEVSK